MAKIKAGKKIKAAFKTFQQQKTKRVKAVTGAVVDVVQARQDAKASKAASRAYGKAAKADALAAGGGYIGRQQAIGQIGTGFIDLGKAAATGGASTLGGLFGGGGSDTFDTGSGQMTSTVVAAPKPFYMEPIFQLAAGIGIFLLLRRKK
tara:strand:- start:940 stop:1386 length:447 start_codon:yes stop_codon:yes gene_type:complete